MSRLVCVTGAGGFVGTHVVKTLLERGHRVRATVRDAADVSRTAHLRTLAGDAAGRLEIMSADLMQPGSFADAVSGCEHVYHLASAVRFTAKDPQREIVDVAVEGTRNVMNAVADAGTVKAVGLTSSISAIAPTGPSDRVLDEDDWVADATVANNPYGLSKMLAEQLAWEIHGNQPEDTKFELVVVNPVLVLGPVYSAVHVRSSPSVVKDLLLGTFKGCADFCFGVVDVRDVAETLVGGIERGGCTGRYILHAKSVSMLEIARILAAGFPEFNVRTNRLPNFLVYIAALFDPRVNWAFLRNNLGRADEICAGKARTEMGVSFRPAEQSILDTARSFVERGLVRPPV